MNQYDQMSPEEQQVFKEEVLALAEDFWVKNFRKQEASRMDKMRYYYNHAMPPTPCIGAIKAFFTENGYWHDGKTTLKQREQDLILENQAFMIERKRILDSKLQDLSEAKKRIEEKEKELNNIPHQLIKEYKIDKKKIMNDLSIELMALFEGADKYLEKEFKNLKESVYREAEERGNALITQSHVDFSNLKKGLQIRLRKEIDGFASELETNLAILQYKEQDDRHVHELDEKIRENNRELNELSRIMRPPSDHVDYSTIEDSIENSSHDDESKEKNEKIPCPFCEKLYKESGLGYTMKQHLDKCPKNPINQDKRAEQEITPKDKVALALSDELGDLELDPSDIDLK